jgi:hypothetical protein
VRLRSLLVPPFVIAALALTAAPAQASFGFLAGSEGFDASLSEEDGSPDTKAGTHPYAMHVHLAFKKAGSFTDGDLRDLHLAMPPGLLLNPTAVDECSVLAFHTHRVSPYEESLSGESCPDKTQVGVVKVHSSYGGGETRSFGVFSLLAPHGAPAALGASPFGVPIVLIPHIAEEDASLTFDLKDFPQGLDVYAIDLTLWGTPWVLAHDDERGNCLNESEPAAPHGAFAAPPGPGGKPPFQAGTCTVTNPEDELEKAYLTLPTSCGAQVLFRARAGSWQESGEVQASALAHDEEGHPLSFTDCKETLASAKAQLTTESAATASGLVFTLDVNDGGGILNPRGIARPPIRTATVALPEGLTINPSLGAGLGTCSEADFARESLATPPGAGCPNPSKVGDVLLEGLLGLPEPVQGSLYIAKPYQNPYKTLLALYIVVSDPARGLFAKSVGKIDADPHTGRLFATFEELPRLLYTHFILTMREGQRAVMISPGTCGSYPTHLSLTPWSEPGAHAEDTSIFNISHGEGGGPCPTGALRPFHPGLEAGSINPQAGAYTPFYLHMTRTDAEQEITSYSATFPPGLTGRLAGVPYCPEAAIEAAKAKTGSEELEHPSCPASSSIGRTLAGYGVGGVLAYAPGALYLAGPWHGAPLSTVAIDSALVGPFDLGVVVVRSAIRIDPRTAQASIDSAGSDPIPHILQGIPIHLRDVRVYVDRPSFTLNPTDCDPLVSLSTLSGAGTDVFSTADDVPASSADRYQAFNCSALGFKPRFAMKLKGTTRRGGFPSLRAVYVPRAGDANIGRATVALPHTEFLAQGHIREICSLRRFAAEACPPSSVYGKAKAETPLLSEPLQGNVYLRSNGGAHNLPDLVVALHGDGGIAIDLVGRIDSTKAGGMRAGFEVLPDAPVTRFTLALQGGKKGLLENSADLCAAPSYAGARFIAQDNATEALRVKMANDCGAKGAHHKRRKR